MRRVLCTVEVLRRAYEIGIVEIPGIARNAEIRLVCNRPAVVLFRGIHERADGSVYLHHWQGRCRVHDDPDWETWIRVKYPSIGGKAIKVDLEEGPR